MRKEPEPHAGSRTRTPAKLVAAIREKVAADGDAIKKELTEHPDWYA